MSETKHFVVIGLGSFGTALALKLAENGCRVTGMDACEQRIEDVAGDLYEAVIGDATERDALEHLSLNKADAVFISLGEDITPSLLATLHAKELGAKQVVVKGVTHEHGRLLKYLGVERVIFPEEEAARELADRMTWPSVLDFLPIDPEYSFIEIAVPDSFSGKSLLDLQLRKRFNIWVVGVKDVLSGKLNLFPEAQFKFGTEQVLLVVGKHADMTRFREIK